jgi:uncharacterized protein YndB with AHSA1/START domain
MSNLEKYVPGPATGAKVEKNDGDKWTLIVTRELRHPPARVWEALTDPAQLAQWAPFDADRNMATVGTVKLTTIGAPQLHVTENTIKRAEAPKLLEYNWGDFNVRWELEPVGAGTRLTIWQNIDRRYVSWGAAGWHVCFDVLEHLLSGNPLGRLTGPEAMKIEGFQRLIGEYTKQFDK